MSAAAPPPPYPSGGYGDSRPPSSSTVNGGERAFKHIQDLRYQALSGYSPKGSIHQLFQDAEVALNQARTLIDFRRPDMSYVEYLRASEIVVEVIPHNKGWPDLQMDQGGGGMQRYHLLQKKINGMAEQYASIKEIIINNNKRSGVRPEHGSAGGHVRTESAPQVNGNNLTGAVGGMKIKPSPSPKPEGLHGRAISTLNSPSGEAGNFDADDSLKDRLAALRSRNRAVDTTRPDSRGSNSSSIHNSPIVMPNASEYGSKNSFDALYPTSSGSVTRPQGPRGMPNGNSGPPVPGKLPALPGKLPLNTNFGTAMPQAPKATYSPARNMQAAGNVEPPRHTARSLASTSTRRSFAAPTSSASSYAPNGSFSSETGDYFPNSTKSMPNGVPPSQVSRRKSVHVPKETRISAERLYDYLELFNVLLIDFRSRQDFDSGHIYARNVICVDPIHVTQGMSADELLDRMVISPEIEQEMFVNRNKFDLVVYYDTQTQSETFLSRPMGELQAKLKFLHEALYDFNHDKPLQRPPILLIGGLEAWADLVGNQALITSDTASRVKQGRPIQRRPVTGNMKLANPKRRLRDYNPLSDEEEQSWRERARAESVVLPSPAELLDEHEGTIPEEGEGGDEEPNSAIRQFNERFPDAGSLDRYAFGPLQPTRTPPGPPEPPPKIPVYPPAPPVSSIPARPQPAAPRMSYTGVSDRAGSQNTPSTRSSSLAPYIPTKYSTANLRLPKTGLENFRFTCYMNATLQAFSGTIPLSIFFQEDTYLRNVQTDNWRSVSKGMMPQLYANLVRSLWRDDVNYIRPSSFRQFVGRLNSEWLRDDQEQDAKEFFDFLVTTLHEDLNFKWHEAVLKDFTPEQEATLEKLPRFYVARMEWERLEHRSQSFLHTLFASQYASKLTFDVCGHTSTTFGSEYSLSVEIPTLSGRYPTLDDCLRSYTSPERLTGADQVRCNQCKENRDATKQITISRAPQYLVVSFKRFRTTGRGVKKIDTPVDFPIENLDLEPYMLPQPSRAEVDFIAQHYPPDYSKAEASMTPPYKYDAYAVVRHIGSSIESGHYTALVKDRARGLWRCFNDRTHEDFIPGQGRFRGANDMRNGQAYIVFYQRSVPTQLGPGGVGKI